MSIECLGFIVCCDECSEEVDVEGMEYVGGVIGEWLFGPDEHELNGWYLDEYTQLCPECRKAAGK